MRTPVWAFVASFSNDANEMLSVVLLSVGRNVNRILKIKEISLQFEHKSWSEMLFKGPYRIRKVPAIKSNELNVIFVVDMVTW